MHNHTIILGKDCGTSEPGDCEGYDQRLPNAFMASVPGHEFWMFLMHAILRGIWLKGVDAPIGPAYSSTGPAPLAWAFEAYLKYTKQLGITGEILVLENEIYPFSWAEHKGSYSLGCCFDDNAISYNATCCHEIFPEAFVVSFWSATWLNER